MSLALALMLGTGLGVRHAVEADHVAAVATFVARPDGLHAAARAGASWGAGHALAIVAAGGTLVAAGVKVPGPLAIALDVAVAVMLLVLGLTALWRARASDPPPLVDAAPSTPPRRKRTAFLAGFVHGASGTATLTLLVATTFRDRAEAVLFLVVFGMASMAAMTLFAAALALPMRALARRGPQVQRRLTLAAGVASLAASVAVAISAYGALTGS